MDKKRYEEIEDFKNAMIFLFSDYEKDYFLKKSKRDDLLEEEGRWITWKGRNILFYNNQIYTGDVPADWFGYNFDDLPWEDGEKSALEKTIHYLLDEREKMIEKQLDVLKNELQQGQSPYSYSYQDEQFQRQYRRVGSQNPLWFKNPAKYYNWYSLKSNLTKKRVIKAINNENEGRSQLYNDLRFLAHKILLEGDRHREYPPSEDYVNIMDTIEEIRNELLNEKTDKYEEAEEEQKQKDDFGGKDKGEISKKVKNAIDKYIEYEGEGGMHFKTIKYYSSKIDFRIWATRFDVYKNGEMMFSIKILNRSWGNFKRLLLDKLKTNSGYTHPEDVQEKILKRVKVIYKNLDDVKDYYAGRKTA